MLPRMRGDPREKERDHIEKRSVYAPHAQRSIRLHPITVVPPTLYPACAGIHLERTELLKVGPCSTPHARGSTFLRFFFLLPIYVYRMAKIHP